MGWEPHNQPQPGAQALVQRVLGVRNDMNSFIRQTFCEVGLLWARHRVGD